MYLANYGVWRSTVCRAAIVLRYFSTTVLSNGLGIAGALLGGWLADRFGRRNLFMLTLAVYLTATVATAFAFAPWYFFIARFFTVKAEDLG